MMFWYGPGMGFWGYLLMTASVVVFFALLLGGFVGLMRLSSRLSQQTEDPRPAHRTAEELLAERFARGEIDEEEYRRRLATLRDGPAAARQP